MTFSKEQIEQLSMFEKQFDGAVYHERLRNAQRWMTEQIVALYESVTNNKLSHNYSCASCLMNIYRHVGTIYFNDKAAYEDMEKSAVVSIEEDDEEKNIEEEKNVKGKKSQAK